MIWWRVGAGFVRRAGAWAPKQGKSLCCGSMTGCGYGVSLYMSKPQGTELCAHRGLRKTQRQHNI